MRYGDVVKKELSKQKSINLDILPQGSILPLGVCSKSFKVVDDSNGLEEALKHAVPKPNQGVAPIKIARVPSKHRSNVKDKERAEALVKYNNMDVGDYIQFDSVSQANRFVHIIRSSGLTTTYRSMDDNGRTIGRVYKNK